MNKRSMLAVVLALVGTAGCVSSKPECPRDRLPGTKLLIQRGECKCTRASPLCPETAYASHEGTPSRPEPTPTPEPSAGKP